MVVAKEALENAKKVDKNIAEYFYEDGDIFLFIRKAPAKRIGFNPFIPVDKSNGKPTPMGYQELAKREKNMKKRSIREL